MNQKQERLNRIVDIVIECCATKDKTGRMSINKGMVFGKVRSENIVMTRAILATAIIRQGYSVTTAACLLGRTVQAVRHLLQADAVYRKSSRAYRIASEEAEKRCQSLDNELTISSGESVMSGCATDGRDGISSSSI